MTFIDPAVTPANPSNVFGQLRFASLSLPERLEKCTWDPSDGHRSSFKPVVLQEHSSVAEMEANCCFDSVDQRKCLQDETWALFLFVYLRSVLPKVVFLMLNRSHECNNASYVRIGMGYVTESHELADSFRSISQEQQKEVVLI